MTKTQISVERGEVVDPATRHIQTSAKSTGTAKVPREEDENL